MVKLTPNNTKYALIGGYGHGNLGDDALMLANVSVMSKKIDRNDITVIIRLPAPNYNYVEKLLPSCNIAPSQPGKEIQYENIIYGGGTMFRAFAGIKKNFYQRAKQIARRCATNPAHAARRVFVEKLNSRSYPDIKAKRSFGLGIGLGPFIDNGRNIQQAKDALQQCRYLSVRDKYSASLCQKWGILKALQRADLCFCPELWGGNSNSPDGSNNKLKCIGVVVRDWIHSKEGASYKQPLQEAVMLLRENGYNVRYITFQNEPGWEPYFSDMNENVLAYSPYSSSVPGFVELLRQFDLIITARAHGAILAATQGIPSICIEIEPKLRYVFESLKEGSKLWNQPFNQSSLLDSVEEISGNLPEYRKMIKSAAMKNCRLAEQSTSEFLEALGTFS